MVKQINKRRKHFLTALLTLICSQSLVGEATDFEEVADSFQRAEWVSLVKITSVGSLINTSMSQGGGVYAVQGYRYGADTEKTWKGEAPSSFKFDVGLGDCRLFLSPNREYIVFGSTDFRGSRKVSRCSDYVAAEETEALFPLLQKLSEVTPEL